MISSRDTAFSFTVVAEGPLSLDPLDGGNYASGVAGLGPLIGSKFGVSAPVLVRYLHPTPVTAKTMADLTRATAEAIWTPDYWTALSCDLLAPGLDLVVCDHGYNRGTAASARVVQALSGAKVDGWLGSDSKTTVNAWLAGPHPATASSAAIQRVQARLRIGVDGKIGPATKFALHDNTNGSVMLGLALIADAQLADYRRLPLFAKDGPGWTARVWNRLTAGLALV